MKLPHLLGAAAAAVLGLSAAPASAAPCAGITLAGGYACDSLSLADVQDVGGSAVLMGMTGGITFLDPNDLLIVGMAGPNTTSQIYQVPVLRDGKNHIVSFGAATLYATAPNMDGGLSFGPGSLSNVLFFTEYNPGDVQLGEIIAGNLFELDLPAPSTSVGALAFDPAGNLVVGKVDDDTFYELTLNPDATIDTSVTPPTATLDSGSPGMLVGPEGIIYSGSQILISSYNDGAVLSYNLGADGLPSGSPTVFLSGLTDPTDGTPSPAEGSVVDPVTGDFLFGSPGNNGDTGSVTDAQLLVVYKAPEPGSIALLASGLFGFGWMRRRRADC